MLKPNDKIWHKHTGQKSSVCFTILEVNKIRNDTFLYKMSKVVYGKSHIYAFNQNTFVIKESELISRKVL